MNKMFGFGFVMTGAPDFPDMEWVEIAPADTDRQDFRYKCCGSIGYAQNETYRSDGESRPLEDCSGLFVGELSYFD